MYKSLIISHNRIKLKMLEPFSMNIDKYEHRYFLAQIRLLKLMTCKINNTALITL